MRREPMSQQNKPREPRKPQNLLPARVAARGRAVRRRRTRSRPRHAMRRKLRWQRAFSLQHSTRTVMLCYVSERHARDMRRVVARKQAVKSSARDDGVQAQQRDMRDTCANGVLRCGCGGGAAARSALRNGEMARRSKRRAGRAQCAKGENGEARSRPQKAAANRHCAAVNECARAATKRGAACGQ